MREGESRCGREECVAVSSEVCCKVGQEHNHKDHRPFKGKSSSLIVHIVPQSSATDQRQQAAVKALLAAVISNAAVMELAKIPLFLLNLMCAVHVNEV